MESLANNHAFIDGKQASQLCHDRRHAPSQRLFLGRRAFEGHKLITEAMEKNGFSLPHDSGLE